jgi:hypothetical protein
MTNYRHAQKLLTELADEMVGEENLAFKILQMKQHLRLVPMPRVLEDVPGESVAEKCRQIDISRQTYYYWLRGVCRPNRKQARRLAQLTRFGIEEINGKLRATPPR